MLDDLGANICELDEESRQQRHEHMLENFGLEGTILEHLDELFAALLSLQPRVEVLLVSKLDQQLKSQDLVNVW